MFRWFFVLMDIDLIFNIIKNKANKHKFESIYLSINNKSCLLSYAKITVERISLRQASHHNIHPNDPNQHTNKPRSRHPTRLYKWTQGLILIEWDRTWLFRQYRIFGNRIDGVVCRSTLSEDQLESTYFECLGCAWIVTCALYTQ